EQDAGTWNTNPFGITFVFESRCGGDLGEFSAVGRVPGRRGQRGLHGGHCGVDRDPGGHGAGVRAVDLTESDAVERHSRVVNGRLEFPRGFLKHRSIAGAVWNYHRCSPPAAGSTDGDTTR